MECNLETGCHRGSQCSVRHLHQIGGLIYGWHQHERRGVVREACAESDLRGDQERGQKMKKTDIRAILDIASKIVDAAKIVLAEDQKPGKKKKEVK